MLISRVSIRFSYDYYDQFCIVEFIDYERLRCVIRIVGESLLIVTMYFGKL